MKLNDMDKALRRSYNRLLKKHRFKQINRSTDLFTIAFWDVSMTSLLYKNKFPELAPNFFKIYPYRFYYFRCLGWFFSSLTFTKVKRQETTAPAKTATISGGVISAIIITVVSGIIILTVWALFETEIIDFTRNMFNIKTKP